MSLLRSLRLVLAAACAALLALTLAACGDDSTEPSQAATSSQYPVTVTNCGAEVTFEKAPERVILLKSAAAPYLLSLGVTEAIIGRAGAYPREYYTDSEWDQLQEIPLMTEELDSAGHLQISKEVVLAQEPDLVLGEIDNLNRETLAAVDIPLLEEPAMCATGGKPASFEDVANQLATYAEVFGVPDAGDAAIAAINQQLDAVRARVDEEENRTAAVLYPTIGGGTTYAYGTHSMAHPQLEAAGFTNVFADTEERVFEVTLEELVGRNPDVLVLLHSDGDPAKVKEAVTGLNGASAITAVQDDAILVQLFNFTEPPSPLVITGLEQIVDAFQS